MDGPCCSRCDADAESEAQSLGASLADGGCSPFDYAAQEEIRERVEDALRQVPEVFRTVVVLREIEGFAYEEIADILQVNLGTVKSRLTRGRAALRRLLAPEKAASSCMHAAISHPDSVSASVSNRASVSEQQSSHADRNRLCTHAGSALDSGAGSFVEVSR